MMMMMHNAVIVLLYVSFKMCNGTVFEDMVTPSHHERAIRCTYGTTCTHRVAHNESAATIVRSRRHRTQYTITKHHGCVNRRDMIARVCIPSVCKRIGIQSIHESRPCGTIRCMMSS